MRYGSIESVVHKKIKNKIVLYFNIILLMEHINKIEEIEGFLNNELQQFQQSIEKIQLLDADREDKFSEKSSFTIFIHLNEVVLDKPKIIGDIAMKLRPILRKPTLANGMDGYIKVGIANKDFLLNYTAKHHLDEGTDYNQILDISDFLSYSSILDGIDEIYRFID